MKKLFEQYAMLGTMMAAGAANPECLKPTPKPTVHKCSECPDFNHKCPCKNGELKPCSKYR